MKLLSFLAIACLVFSGAGHADVPATLHYQGVVSVHGAPFTGTGGFRFSILDGTGAVVWNQDGTLTGAPAGGVSLPVQRGVYSVVLGDTTIAGMSALPVPSLQALSSASLRVWFSDGTHGWQQLAPDFNLSSEIYAFVAGKATRVSGSLGSEKFAAGAVTSSKLADGAVHQAHLANASVTTAKLADAAVGSSQFAAGSVTSAKLSAGAAATQSVGLGLLPVGAAVLSTPDSDATLVAAGFVKSAAAIAPLDEWRVEPTSPNTNSTNTSIVWTGTEMLLFPGNPYTPQRALSFNRTTNRWTALPLTGLTTMANMRNPFWTGSEVISWGGAPSITESKAIWSPAQRTWRAMGTSGAPADNLTSPCRVWTGSQLLQWGGEDPDTDDETNTGFAYHPETNTWTPMSTTGAPSARYGATCEWTGTEMLVWGGSAGFPVSRLNTGGRYNPATDTWTSMTTVGAPAARTGASSVWTGSQMIVFGDEYASDNGVAYAYTPASDSWTALPLANQASERSNNKIFWTGTEVIIWGGKNLGNDLYDGARYNPSTNSWTPIPAGLPNAPDWPNARAVWTGTEMLVWGGYFVVPDGIYSVFDPVNNGAAYHPASNTWSRLPVPTVPWSSPAPKGGWNGSEFIVWGQEEDPEHPGVRGHRFDPTSGLWSAIPTASAPPTTLDLPSVAVSPDSLFLFGGVNAGIYQNGGYRHDLASGTWWTVPPAVFGGTPFAVSGAESVWTGSEFLVWGGTLSTGFLSNLGGRYNPITGVWTALSTVNAPYCTANRACALTGTEFLFWGGAANNGRYNLATNTWSAISTVNAPTGTVLRGHWTGSKFLVLAGGTEGTPLVLHRYDPATDTWSQSSTLNAPSVTSNPQSAWVNGELFLWSGSTGSASTFTHASAIALYDPVADTWRNGALVPPEFSGRTNALTAWTGTELLIFGGTSAFDANFPGGARNDLARFHPRAFQQFLYVKEE